MYDVSGPENIIVAVIAAAFVPVESAAQLANVAAGIVVSKVGADPAV